MLPTIDECRKVIGKQIRNDTYLFMKRLDEGESYEDIYEDLDLNREKYNIKKDLWLSSKRNCNKNLKMIYEDSETKKEKKTNINKQTGVYCIKINNNIVYIGKTLAGFGERFKSHKRQVEDTNNDLYLYRLLRGAKQAGSCLTFEPIIILEDVEEKENKKFSDKEVSLMEFALIQAYQPIGNIQGRITPYYN